jgi:hypothetical protein
LQELRLNNLRMLPLRNYDLPNSSELIDLELAFAPPSLAHLHSLIFSSHEVGSLHYLPSLPSLRQLHLFLSLLPSATKLELLLRLCCLIQPYSSEGRPEWQVQNEAMLPHLDDLARRCPRLVLQDPSS